MVSELNHLFSFEFAFLEPFKYRKNEVNKNGKHSNGSAPPKRPLNGHANGDGKTNGYSNGNG